jgi:hypothetical protein
MASWNSVAVLGLVTALAVAVLVWVRGR